MIINHNMSAIFADRQLNAERPRAGQEHGKALLGKQDHPRRRRRFRASPSRKRCARQIRGLRQASTNASNGISFIQTTEGYLQESQDIIQRLRELSVQSANGIYTDEDRMQIQVEVSALVNEVDRIASHAQFNGMNMLTGRFARQAGQNVITASMWLQIGANMDQRTRVFIGTMTSEALGIRNPGSKQIISLSTPDGANRVHRAAGHGVEARSTSSGRTWGPTRTASSTR